MQSFRKRRQVFDYSARSKMKSIADSDSEFSSLFESSPRPNVRTVFYVESPIPSGRICKSPSPTFPLHYFLSPYLSPSSSSESLNNMKSNCYDIEANHKFYSKSIKYYANLLTIWLCLAASAVMFVLAAIILWKANSHVDPRFRSQSFSMDYFHVGIGIDHSGVPTNIVAFNSSVEISIFNPAAHYGIYVTSIDASLFYYQIRLARSHDGDFYLPEQGSIAKSIILNGDQVPLYGAGNGSGPSQTTSIVFPMTLKLALTTHRDVIGFLLRLKESKHITCNFVIDSNIYEPIMLSKEICISTP